MKMDNPDLKVCREMNYALKHESNLIIKQTQIRCKTTCILIHFALLNLDWVGKNILNIDELYLIVLI